METLAETLQKIITKLNLEIHRLEHLVKIQEGRIKEYELSEQLSVEVELALGRRIAQLEHLKSIKWNPVTVKM